MAKALLTVGEVAARLDVSADTVRRMERSGVLIPQRTSGRQRRYRLSDVERVECRVESELETAADRDNASRDVVGGRIDRLRRHAATTMSGACGRCLGVLIPEIDRRLTAEVIPAWVADEEAREMAAAIANRVEENLGGFLTCDPYMGDDNVGRVGGETMCCWCTRPLSETKGERAKARMRLA